MALVFRVLNFAAGCFRVPAFYVATFFSYLKLTGVAIDSGAPAPVLTAYFIRGFSAFVYEFYEWTLILFIEFVGLIVSHVLAIFALGITIDLPNWYSGAAFFSTILYGAQRASSTLYGPATTFSMDPDDKNEWNTQLGSLGPWKSAWVSLAWSMIMIIYIPVNWLSMQVSAQSSYQFLPISKAANTIKTGLGGFFMLGFLFLVHDLLAVWFLRGQCGRILEQHRNFLRALVLAMLISVLATALTVYIGFATSIA